MIDANVMREFFETLKVASNAATAKKMSAGMKALLATTAVGGVAGGAVGRRAHDDMQIGRRMRMQQGG